MKFSVILPAFNEAASLPMVIENIKTELDKINIDYEIIVVDNGSTDNTPKVLSLLKQRFVQLKSTKIWPNIGYGNGILEGLKSAKGEVLSWIDADGQIEAKYLINGYLKLVNEKLDLCKGVRVVRYDSLFRRLTSKCYNFLFKIMFGGNLKDLGAKPKIFKRELFEDIKPVSKDWFLDSEILIKSLKRNYKIGEIPVNALPRSKGVSKIRISTIFEFLKNMFYYWFFIK